MSTDVNSFLRSSDTLQRAAMITILFFVVPAAADKEYDCWYLDFLSSEFISSIFHMCHRLAPLYLILPVAE